MSAFALVLKPGSFVAALEEAISSRPTDLLFVSMLTLVSLHYAYFDLIGAIRFRTGAAERLVLAPLTAGSDGDGPPLAMHERLALHAVFLVACLVFLVVTLRA